MGISGFGPHVQGAPLISYSLDKVIQWGITHTGRAVTYRSFPLGEEGIFPSKLGTRLGEKEMGVAAYLAFLSFFYQCLYYSTEFMAIPKYNKL